MGLTFLLEEGLFRCFLFEEMLKNVIEFEKSERFGESHFAKMSADFLICQQRAGQKEASDFLFS